MKRYENINTPCGSLKCKNLMLILWQERLNLGRTSKNYGFLCVRTFIVIIIVMAVTCENKTKRKIKIIPLQSPSTYSAHTEFMQCTQKKNVLKNF